jgi:hypothetical protein
MPSFRRTEKQGKEFTDWVYKVVAEGYKRSCF